jgi:hypothetical protein
MKKLFIVFIVALCVLATASLAAAAAKSIEGSGFVGATGSTLSIATSSNVRITYEGSDQAYGAIGEHKAGNRAYATGSSTPGIFYKEKVAGNWTTETASTTFSGSGWTAQ